MPILFLGLLIAGLLTALIYDKVTYCLMERTHPILAFAAGLALMAVPFTLGHFGLVSELHDYFLYSSPLCSDCGLVVLPLAFWWLVWLVSAVLYVVASIKGYLSLSGPGYVAHPLPAGFWRWLVVLLIGVVAVYLGNRLYRQAQITSLAQRIATLSPIETWQLTELGTMALPATRRIEIIPAGADMLQFNSNGRWLMTVQGYWSDVGIWQVSNLEERFSFPRCDEYYRDHPARFSPDGLRLAILECDGRLSLYHLESGQREWSEPLVGEFIFTKDSQSLIILRELTLIQFSVGDGVILHQVDLPELSQRYSHRFSEDGNYLLIQHLDEGRDEIYDARTGVAMVSLQDGQMVSSSEVEAPIYFEYSFLWNGQQLQSAIPPDDKFIRQAEAAGFSTGYTPHSILSDDKRLALFAARGVVVWSQTEERVIQVIPFQPYITTLALSPDQRLLVGATDDGGLHFWGEVP
jgi:hypothetical protein